MVLEYLASAFEPGRRYDESSVNATLRRLARGRRRATSLSGRGRVAQPGEGGVLAHRRLGRRKRVIIGPRGNGSSQRLNFVGCKCAMSVVGVSARGQVPPFYVMRILEAVAQRRASGLLVYDLTAGQPSTPAPAHVRAEAHRVLDADRIGYTGALGLPVLRDAIAAHYRRTYGIDVQPGDVAVATGSSGAFLLAFLAAFEPGDVVVVAQPGYPAYRNMLTALGCTVLPMPCGPETRFQPTIRMLDALDAAPAGLVLASPANPTGSMVPPERTRRHRALV